MPSFRAHDKPSKISSTDVHIKNTIVDIFIYIHFMLSGICGEHQHFTKEENGSNFSSQLRPTNPSRVLQKSQGAEERSRYYIKLQACRSCVQMTE